MLRFFFSHVFVSVVFRGRRPMIDDRPPVAKLIFHFAAKVRFFFRNPCLLAFFSTDVDFVGAPAAGGDARVGLCGPFAQFLGGGVAQPARERRVARVGALHEEQHRHILGGHVFKVAAEPAVPAVLAAFSQHVSLPWVNTVPHKIAVAVAAQAPPAPVQILTLHGKRLGDVIYLSYLALTHADTYNSSFMDDTMNELLKAIYLYVLK